MHIIYRNVLVMVEFSLCLPVSHLYFLVVDYVAVDQETEYIGGRNSQTGEEILVQELKQQSRRQTGFSRALSENTNCL